MTFLGRFWCIRRFHGVYIAVNKVALYSAQRMPSVNLRQKPPHALLANSLILFPITF